MNSVSLPPRVTSAIPHYPAVDGLRGVAILLVLVAHARWAVGESTHIDRFVKSLTGVGWSGVTMFFVLSGFLITGILLNTREQPQYFKVFYSRRALRIFPLYYLSLLVLLMVGPAVSNHVASLPEQQYRVYYFVYLQNWIRVFDPNYTGALVGHFWSLAIEEQFYLVWPLVIWFTPVHVLRWVCIGLILASPLARGCAVMADLRPLSVYGMTFSQFDSLAAGALVAVWMFGPSKMPQRKTLWLVCLVCIAGLVAVALWRGRVSPHNRVGVVLGPSLFTGVYVSLLMLALEESDRMGPLARAFSASPIRMLGKYSYAIYVVHIPLRWMTLKWFPELRQHQSAAMFAEFMIGYTLASLAIAVISWHLIEKHFLALKRYLAYSPTPATNPTKQTESDDDQPPHT